MPGYVITVRHLLGPDERIIGRSEGMGDAKLLAKGAAGPAAFYATVREDADPAPLVAMFRNGEPVTGDAREFALTCTNPGSPLWVLDLSESRNENLGAILDALMAECPDCRAPAGERCSFNCSSEWS